MKSKSSKTKKNMASSEVPSSALAENNDGDVYDITVFPLKL
jgi:hypothetical protein